MARLGKSDKQDGEEYASYVQLVWTSDKSEDQSRVWAGVLEIIGMLATDRQPGQVLPSGLAARKNPAM